MPTESPGGSRGTGSHEPSSTPRRPETGWRGSRPPLGCCCTRTRWGGLLQKTNAPAGGHQWCRNPQCLGSCMPPLGPNSREAWVQGPGYGPEAGGAAAELDSPPTILSTRAPSSTTAQASSQGGERHWDPQLPPWKQAPGQKGGQGDRLPRDPGRKGTPVLHSHLEHHLSAPWTPFLRGNVLVRALTTAGSPQGLPHSSLSVQLPCIARPAQRKCANTLPELSSKQGAHCLGNL